MAVFEQRHPAPEERDTHPFFIRREAQNVMRELMLPAGANFSIRYGYRFTQLHSCVVVSTVYVAQFMACPVLRYWCRCRLNPAVAIAGSIASFILVSA